MVFGSKAKKNSHLRQFVFPSLVLCRSRGVNMRTYFQRPPSFLPQGEVLGLRVLFHVSARSSAGSPSPVAHDHPLMRLQLFRAASPPFPLSETLRYLRYSPLVPVRTLNLRWKICPTRSAGYPHCLNFERVGRYTPLICGLGIQVLIRRPES